MRIAVAADEEMINQHFSETSWFRLYDVEGKQVTRELRVPSFGGGASALVSSLSDYKVNVLICGALDGKTKVSLGDAGILVFGGIIGKTEPAVEALISGTLTACADSGFGSDGCSGSCGENCKSCQLKN